MIRNILFVQIDIEQDFLVATTEPVTAGSARTTDEELVIVLADREVHIRWEDCSPALAAATNQQRCRIELSPGGYGIHWPMIDEDLSVSGLMKQGQT
jgi:hypothetical protein